MVRRHTKIKTYERKILFDHFLNGIHQAGYDLYDLHPLSCKKFSSLEVINLFRQFESKVCENPFWEKSDKIMFINGKGKLEVLDLQNEEYYILNERYCTNTSWDFFNSTFHAFFCPVSQENPLWASYESCYKGNGICLKYSSLASNSFKYYGEDFYMKNIRPHIEIFKTAIVDIFKLKKFPEEIIRKNKLEDLEFSIINALEHEEYDYYIEKANEYLEIAKNFCPELENHPTYQEIPKINDDFKKFQEEIMKRVDPTIKPILEEIIPKVKKSIQSI